MDGLTCEAATKRRDPATLRRDHDTALKLITGQGFILADDPVAYERCREAMGKVMLALHDIILPSLLAFVFVFDQTQQPPSLSGFDGYASVSAQLPDGRVASIGIAVQALEAGEDYAVLILLHELAHITANSTLVKDNHSGVFHLWLDELILRYNKFHGTHVVNDYIK